MASKNRKIKREKSSSPSSESSDDSPPPQQQQLKKPIQKPPPTSTQKRKKEISSSSESDDTDVEVQQVKNDSGSKDAIVTDLFSRGKSMAAANNNSKVNHADVGKNTTAAAATNSSSKAPVRAQKEKEKPKPKDAKAIKHNVESDSDEHPEPGNRHERASSSNSTSIPSNVLPKDMYNFCKFILELGEQNSIHLTGKRGTCKFATLVGSMPDLDPNIDVAAMQNSFNLMYRWSTNLSEVPLVDALKRVMDYVQGEQVLLKYPTFPRLAVSSWNVYLKQQGVTAFHASSKLLAKYKNKQDKGVIAAEEEFQRNKENHITHMKEFMERYKDQLFQSQIDALQKKIRKLEKENGKKEPKGPRAKRVKPEPPAKPTAFELYKKTAEKDPKYAHLSAEDKEAKLLRRFNKLPEEQRQIFESIAENY